MMPRPNVVVFLADDLGYGDLEIYGNAALRTPHLNRLAGEGVRLNQHYSGSPLCAPARASLLTGRYNHRTGAISVESNRGLDRIALHEATIADVFKQAGYATGMVGKWHNGLHDMRYHPNNRGFDEFCGFLNGGMGYWDWVIERNSQPQHSDGTYLTEVFTDEAVQFIERHTHDPFFLYVAYNAPHNPLQAPADEVQPLLENDSINPAVATLYAMIQRMDSGIGRILDTLAARGLDDNTIILFTSDNGPWLGNDRLDGEVMSMARFNGPFRGMKQDVLEGGIRVPALLRWRDGLPANMEYHDMVHFTDWLPTLMAACGISTLPDLPLDGLNQLATLQGETGVVPAQRFWQYNRYDPVGQCNAAMRDGDWKLYWPRIPEAMVKLASDNEDYHQNMHRPHLLEPVANPPVARTLSEPGAPQLYNINDDPYEANDLSAQQPDRLNRMKTTLENWFETVEKERASLHLL
ncbi:MAG: arylsulfatase [Anaerolineaceae bacterium]|nr:arylsulfatase [Anaerolineaceae bacterium]